MISAYLDLCLLNIFLWWFIRFTRMQKQDFSFCYPV